MNKSLNISQCCNDDPQSTSFITGTISNKNEKYDFLMTCKPGFNSCWLFFIKLKNGGYIIPSCIPIFTRQDYPVSITTWIMNNMDQLINSIKMKRIKDSNKVIIDYQKEEQFQEKHHIIGTITNNLDSCKFTLSCYSGGLWYIYIAKTNSKSIYSSYPVPRFFHKCLADKSIIKWMGENSQKLIDYSKQC